jgi:MarR family transcriptional regulator, organic hydroperoxide resistance regulator
LSARVGGKLETRVSYLLNSAGGRHALALAQELREHGVRYTSWRALHTLSLCGPLGLSEIALLANFDLSTLSRVVDGLEADGLVVRLSAPGRGVRRRIQLAQRGRALVARLEPIAARHEQRLLRGLSHDERVQLTALLRRVRANALEERTTTRPRRATVPALAEPR